jgi:predicted MFS family arabinose efflux permease
LTGAPVDLKTWVALGRNRNVLLLLLVTTLQMSGQFVVFTFMAPLLRTLTGAGAHEIGLVFAAYGICGFLGVLLASRIVDSWGAWRTSVLFTTLVFAALVGWALSAGVYWLMVGAVAVWGLGFASTNSMQQVRLVAAAPSTSARPWALRSVACFMRTTCFTAWVLLRRPLSPW